MSQPASPSNPVDIDPNVDGSGDGKAVAQAMATAMGFSSFGTQDSDRPAKKRRYDDGNLPLPVHPKETDPAAHRGGRGGRGGRGSSRGSGRGGWQGGGRGGGEPGGSGSEPWWTDYYDPSSNENPWERLEQARGIEPVGTWLPTRQSHNKAGGVAEELPAGTAE